MQKQDVNIVLFLFYTTETKYIIEMYFVWSKEKAEFVTHTKIEETKLTRQPIIL